MSRGTVADNQTVEPGTTSDADPLTGPADPFDPDEG